MIFGLGWVGRGTKIIFLKENLFSAQNPRTHRAAVPSGRKRTKETIEGPIALFLPRIRAVVFGD